MSFSSPVSGQAPTTAQNIGQQFQGRYPIAGGLAQMVFGGNKHSPDAAPPEAVGQLNGPAPSAYTPAVMPPQQVTGNEAGDIISMNAQPPRDGGVLSGLLKSLFMV